MMIVVGTIPRSGSTWLFNVARLLLSEEGDGIYGAWIEDYDEGNPSRIHLVKAHAPDESLAKRADIVLSSRRHLFDTARSAVRMGWVDPDLQIVKNWLSNVVRIHRFWRSHSALEVEYQDIVVNPAACVQRIADVLNMPISDETASAIAAAVDKLPVPDEKAHYPRGHHPTTLLHPKHRSDRNGLPVVNAEWENRLAAMIATHFGEWLRENNYLQAPRAEAPGPESVGSEANPAAFALEDPVLGCRRAGQLLAGGSFSEAERVILAVLDQAPTMGAAYHLNSHIQERLGRPDAAAAASARAVELGPDQAKWRARYGSLLLRLERFEEAAAALRQAVENGVADAPTLMNLARACAALGKGEEAIAAAERAAATASENAAAARLLAQVREKWPTHRPLR